MFDDVSSDEAPKNPDAGAPVPSHRVRFDEGRTARVDPDLFVGLYDIPANHDGLCSTGAHRHPPSSIAADFVVMDRDGQSAAYLDTNKLIIVYAAVCNRN